MVPCLFSKVGLVFRIEHFYLGDTLFSMATHAAFVNESMRKENQFLVLISRPEGSKITEAVLWALLFKSLWPV